MVAADGLAIATPIPKLLFDGNGGDCLYAFDCRIGVSLLDFCVFDLDKSAFRIASG
jgi:hypothetical protein